MPAVIAAAIPLLVLGVGGIAGSLTDTFASHGAAVKADCPIIGGNAYGDWARKFGSGGGNGNGNGNGNWGNNNGNGNSGSFNGNGNLGDNHGNHVPGDCSGNGPLPWWLPAPGASRTSNS